MPPLYIAAIDQGTTSTRCMIFDRHSRVIASHQLEHRQIYPQAGWVEHDPLEIWQRTRQVIHGALEKGRLATGDIAAIGITNQRETTLVWDKRTGQPYYNAIVWQDTRTAAICHALANEGGQDRFRERVGLPLATYFSGPKIMWLLDYDPAIRRAAERGEALFGNIDSWLIWWLTGGPQGGIHMTDPTNASRTMLMDLRTLDWDPEILEIMDIPRQMLPTIRPSADPALYGQTLQTGPFAAAIPICGDLGDQHAALFGQTCFTAGEAKNTYGTGCFMLLNTGTDIVPSRHGLLTTLGYKIADQPAVYALEGSVAITGALVQWLRDNLGIIQTSAEVESLARTVADSGGIYFVPAFSGLFAPYWRSDARGAILGLTRYVNSGHLARATLEATAYQTREILDAMNQDSGVPLTTLKVDGGMVTNQLLMQFQADILGVPVVCPTITETTALGAAYAAGLAIGLWQEIAELRANWAIAAQWQPAMDAAKRESLFAGWKKAVRCTFGWVEE
ncbi:MAG: glycerol kinase [Chloroflexi bacterium]|nr:glycerol kinase [Chloroflexota bacterium]